MKPLCKCGCEKETGIAKRTRYELKGYIKGEPIPFWVGHQARTKNIKGENHWNFKGNNAGYKAMHLRVGQLRGKASICEDCGSDKRVEWASLTKKYEDINDYKALCKKCHNNFDRINEKRVKTLGKEKLKEIAKKVWETRRKKTSFEASSVSRPAEGVDAMS